MFKSLPGFREFYPDECSARNFIFKKWREISLLFCFSEYDAPLLEPLELFTEKSGDEIVSQLFSFEDKGGRAVALRPEMTPSLARLVGAKGHSLPKPIKWFSIGEQFRYERPQKGRLRSFYQLNCDIIGEPGTGADAECIALLIRLFTEFGLTDKDFCIRLSDRDLWVLLLKHLGYKEETISQLLVIIDKLEREKEEVTRNKLEKIIGNDANALLEKINKLTKIKNLEELKRFFEQEHLNGEELVKRISDWEDLLTRLKHMGLESFIKIDLSIVRGLAYYTGFVFEVFQTFGQARALAGGGRYDHLLKKLTGVDLPAVGFAIGDVTLKDCLVEKNLLNHETLKVDVFVAIETEELREQALEDITKLRKRGYSVEYPLKMLSFNKQLKQASQSGARFAFIYKVENMKNNQFILKDLEKREEVSFLRSELESVSIETFSR